MALPQTYIDLDEEPAAEPASAPLRLLWLLPLNSNVSLAHGGNLRFFNYGKELLALGHHITFVTLKSESDKQRSEYLELKRRRIVSDCFEVEYQHPWLRGKFAHLLMHPGLANFVLRSDQAPTVNAIRQIIAAQNIDVCIVSSRDLLFAVPAINSQVKTVIDWVDSYFLYHLREARLHLKRFRPGKALAALRLMAESLIQESYFGRRATANMVVSPVDKKYLDFANRTPGKNRLLPNGVAPTASKFATKIKGRLIFTGNMDFPPNYQSALWFIDKVFPLVRERCDVHLVVAGANPVEELLVRANEKIRVTGYVEDMHAEIAQSELYIAPLVCGGGFKNKVVEAIASGTFVVGTNLATEFLPAAARDCIPAADTARELAEVIVNYLQGPQHFAGNLEALRRILIAEFSWEARSQQLLEIVRPPQLRTGRGTAV